MPLTRLGSLELDLDVFAGPFDLLCSLILREELDLLEVDLADVVLAYLDHLEARERLDLEAVTEFLLLIAALLELKSRLMLPGDEELSELDELAPAEAADELLARMLEYLRHRGAAAWLTEAMEAGQGWLERRAPAPRELRRASLQGAQAAFAPDTLGAALGGLLRTPAPIDVGHMADPRVALPERVALLRGLLRRGSFSFDDAVRGADRMTEAVTVFALLELYKRGEAEWEQAKPFGPILVASARAAAPLEVAS